MAHSATSIQAALRLGDVEIECNVCGQHHTIAYAHSYNAVHCATTRFNAGLRAMHRVIDLRPLRRATGACLKPCAQALKFCNSRGGANLLSGSYLMLDETARIVERVRDFATPASFWTSPSEQVPSALGKDLPIHWFVALPVRNADRIVALMLLYQMLHASFWKLCACHVNAVGSVVLTIPEASSEASRLLRPDYRMLLSRAVSACLRLLEIRQQCASEVDGLCAAESLSFPCLRANAELRVLWTRKIYM